MLNTFTRRLKNAVRAPLAAALALLAVTAGVRGIFEPETLPLAEVLGTFVGYMWAVVYGSGGTLMLYGMSTLRTKFEAAGCVLFGGGAFVQAMATLFFLDASPFLTIWNVVSLLILTAGAVIRTRHLIKGQILIWLTQDDSSAAEKAERKNKEESE